MKPYDIVRVRMKRQEFDALVIRHHNAVNLMVLRLAEQPYTAIVKVSDCELIGEWKPGRPFEAREAQHG